MNIEKQIIEKMILQKEIKNENGRRVKTKSHATLVYHGILHNENGPAIIKDDGYRAWYKMGKVHRENGPAIISTKGQYWMREDKYHREGFPAVVMVNGRREWYIDGKLHREDGPAIEDPERGNQWWVNGVFVRKED